MYSPARLALERRAAPAKKRRLSAQNGISSRDAISGLPTFSDSSCASSSAFSSITSASLSRSSERSPGVLSSHSGSASSPPRPRGRRPRRRSAAPRRSPRPSRVDDLHRLAGRAVDPLAADEVWYVVFVALIVSSYFAVPRRGPRCRASGAARARPGSPSARIITKATTFTTAAAAGRAGCSRGSRAAACSARPP